MAKATKNPVDFKAALKKVAPKATEKKSSSPGLRELPVPTDFTSEVVTLCELGYIYKQVETFLDQYKGIVGNRFFDLWTEEMWQTRNAPANFRAPVNKPDSPFRDCCCTFQLKFRKDAIGKGPQKRVPNQLPEGVTVQEHLVKVLSDTKGMVGLTKKDAQAFVDTEIVITEQYGLRKDIDWMLDQEPGDSWRNIGDKLMAHLTCRSRDDLNNLSLFSDEEFSELIGCEQTVTLKEDLEARVFSYCKSLDQLRKLLRFLNVTQQVSNFDFGISDEATEKVERMKTVVGRFLVTE